MMQELGPFYLDCYMTEWILNWQSSCCSWTKRFAVWHLSFFHRKYVIPPPSPTLKNSSQCKWVKHIWWQKQHLHLLNRLIAGSSESAWWLKSGAHYILGICLGSFVIRKPTLSCSHWWEFVYTESWHHSAWISCCQKVFFNPTMSQQVNV